MKSLSFLFVVVLFTYSGNLYSQMGYGNNQTRVNPSMNDSRMSDRIAEFEKENNKAQKIAFDKMLVKIKTDLNLDELQYYAIEKTLTNSLRDQNILMKKEIPEEDKITQLLAIDTRTDIEINSYLSKEQKEKYKVFNEEKNKRINNLKTNFQKQ
jgi:hypothetical protein